MSMERSDNAAAGVIVGIGVIGFALSYEALYTAAVAAGMDSKLAYGYPLIVEGFVTIATWTAYRLRDRGWKATAYPWLLAVAFFGYSLWVNAMPDTLLGPVVRGVPSVALGFAVHLFTQLRKKRNAEPVALVELLDDEEAEEPLSDEPWPAWEAPAEQPALPLASTTFEAEKPRPASVHAAVRTWARQNGFDVKETGRMPQSVYAAFEQAHA
jgi:hypothetical protein